LSSIDELLLCLKTVASGRTYVCQAAAQHVANSIIQPTLTSREEGVLQLLALGFCNKLIAKELGIAVGTTKAHVRAIMSKLDAATRTEAARVAAERGFLNATWNSRGTLPTRRTRDTASGPDAPVISFHMGTYLKGPLRPDRPPPPSSVATR
jgi:DNA-binding CsgD family transcriptional regulator